jgi:cold shock CspA family protein
MVYGNIVRLVPEHGFGFIVDDSGLDWFFVERGVRSGKLGDLWLDERVGFSSEWTSTGPRATDIHHEQLD